VVVYDTSDPEVVILECGLRGRIESTGEKFDLPFIMVMTVRDGHIVRSRDYSDPIVGARISGTLPQLIDALTVAATEPLPQGRR
jgi:ketosteroid isomerase-like protein